MHGSVLDWHLQHHKANDHRVSIYIANGLKFDGTIVEFDSECIVINGKAQEQVIMRRAILTVQRCTTLSTSHKPAR